jgi:hypothetical protein
MNLLWATTDIHVRLQEAVKWKAAQLSPKVTALRSMAGNECDFIVLMFNVSSKTRWSVLVLEWGNITCREGSQFNYVHPDLRITGFLDFLEST